eukprot:8677298-Prorocentrum_lima.AAC.1
MKPGWARAFFPECTITHKQHSALSHSRTSRLSTAAADTWSWETSLSSTARSDWCVYTACPPAPAS